MATADNTVTFGKESNPAIASVAPRNRPAAPKKSPSNVERFKEAEPRDYNLNTITDFLDLVFHAGTAEGAQPLVWAVDAKRAPVYPMSEDDLMDLLATTKKGKALYYGTASTRPDAAGKLYNRQALFDSLHVIVLDDIGTKGDELPEGMTPTYIIESSKDNFQYGYVLETPISDLEAAKALVAILYEAGISDGGGKMPNKLVRLPEGINGKAGEKMNFVSNLISMDGPLWTPQGLLDVMDAGTDWADIEADALEATKRRSRLKGGSTPWAPYRPVMSSMAGVIDPVAEWLNEQDYVYSENGEWLVVQCPYRDQHTSGGDTAGYKPLGVGEDPSRRAFHCFHDSCKTVHTRDYLDFVAQVGGPNAGVEDKAADMVSSYVYDTINDCAWKIKGTTDPKMITMSGLKNTHPRKTLVSTADGKLTPVSEYQQWLMSESRVLVMGTIFNPSNPARLVPHEGDLYVNQFAPPPWGVGPYEELHVSKFLGHVEYLIPDEDERKYFLDWLAAKCQDMGFRGAAIVMIAQAQGVGRSTLTDMISTMLGKANVRNEPFEKIVGETQYNDWIEAPMIVTDESLATGGVTSYKVYEKLKELIDPRPRLMTVNPKYGKQRRSMVHSSFIFLSNHSNALSIAEDDRRFYVITNPYVPRPPEYYSDLNEWIDTTNEEGDPVWVQHVYRWLMEREVDMPALLAPPVKTAGKQLMMDESRSDLDTLGNLIFASWPCEYITSGQFNTAVEHFADRIALYDQNNYKGQLKRMMGGRTYALGPSSVIRLEGKSVRLRVIMKRASSTSTVRGENICGEARKEITAALHKENIAHAMKKVSEALDLAGL